MFIFAKSYCGSWNVEKTLKNAEFYSSRDANLEYSILSIVSEFSCVHPSTFKELNFITSKSPTQALFSRRTSAPRLFLCFSFYILSPPRYPTNFSSSPAFSLHKSTFFSIKFFSKVPPRCFHRLAFPSKLEIFHVSLFRCSRIIFIQMLWNGIAFKQWSPGSLSNEGGSEKEREKCT